MLHSLIRQSFTALAAVFILLSLGGMARAVDPARYAGCDLRVLYLYDDPAQIDWPTVYYLNDAIGCRIELVAFREGGALYVNAAEVAERRIYRTDLFLPVGAKADLDSAFTLIMGERRPDIIVLAPDFVSPLQQQVTSYLLDLPPDTAALFDIRKIFRQVPESAESWAAASVTMTSRELASRYQDRMALELLRLFPHLETDQYRGRQLTRYEPIKLVPGTESSEPSLTAGLRSSRLEPLLDSLLSRSRVREALANRARNIEAFLMSSQNNLGRPRVEDLIRAYKELIQLQYQCRSTVELTSTPGFLTYLDQRLTLTRTAVLGEMGLEWDGQIFIRESPHGPKVKFRAQVAVNGPVEVELSYIRFNPYWDTTAMVLDSVSRKIAPHQSLVREFLVDVDPMHLETTRPESLLFTAEIVYGQIPLEVQSAMPLWSAPELTVRFEPAFNFVPPVARTEVDRLVSSMNWKVILTKPRSYAGTVRLALEVPRGLFAGAYQQEIVLQEGHSSEVVRIPFSVSNLFELGGQKTTIKLLVNDRLISSDTARVGIAACEIPAGRTIGFLSDSTGVLEDILRMSQANFQALTDRTLWTGDLDVFDVIVVGSGAFRMYPSLTDVSGRLEQYIRNGGSLVILGQPYDWPKGVLPMSLTPSLELVTAGDITNLIAGANVLTVPYRVDKAELLASFGAARPAAAAVIAPSERVFSTPSGATVLSVSRLGAGQMIYCGLPLTDLIAELNLQAIHLFANLLNY